MIFGTLTRDSTVDTGDSNDNHNPYYPICIMVGVFMQYFLLAGVLWTLCIAHTLFLILYYNDYEAERFEKFYHLFCWCVPALTVIILLATSSFGDSELWFILFFIIPFGLFY